MSAVGHVGIDSCLNTIEKIVTDLRKYGNVYVLCTHLDYYLPFCDYNNYEYDDSVKDDITSLDKVLKGFASFGKVYYHAANISNSDRELETKSKEGMFGYAKVVSYFLKDYINHKISL